MCWSFHPAFYAYISNIGFKKIFVKICAFWGGFFLSVASKSIHLFCVFWIEIKQTQILFLSDLWHGAGLAAAPQL